jgi:hypothetical protein
MRRPVQLDRNSMALVACIAALAAGCGQKANPPAASPASVSTTSVTAADYEIAPPKVGQPQAHVDASVPETDTKAEPRRHGDRKPGGGFSGYK